MVQNNNPETEPYTDAYFTNTDGLRQHYRDYNNAPIGAPVVLCMPGLSRNAKDFGFIADHLSNKCQLICVEQRGRGLSDWDPKPERYTPATYVEDMFTLLEHLGVEKVIALGTSLGGLMTIMMQALKPGVFKAAIINDIGPEIDPKGIERITSYIGKGTPPKTWKEAIDSVKFANRGVYPDFGEEDWAMLANFTFKDDNGIPVSQYDPAIRQNFENNRDQSAPDLWPLFDALKTIPMVVLRGELSDILSASTLKRMAEAHPDLTPVTVKGLGHVPLMREIEAKNAIDELVNRFLD